MTEGQYESGDKREREKVAAKRGGCEMKRLGEEEDGWAKGQREK